MAFGVNIDARGHRAELAASGNAAGKFLRYNNTHLRRQVRVFGVIDYLHLDQYRLFVWLAGIEEEQVWESTVCRTLSPRVR